MAISFWAAAGSKTGRGCELPRGNEVPGVVVEESGDATSYDTFVFHKVNS